jgi:uncharacterized protein (DUF169 family)
VSPKKRDYSVLDKFNFERKPIGVKYLLARPKDIPRIAKDRNFCEMIKEAQESGPFYVGPEDWRCVGVEQMILGMKDAEPILVSGMVGGEENLYKEANACREMYKYIPRMQKGSVKYVAFAPLDQMNFDPDVLIITADINQAQTLVRCINYSTGTPVVSKVMPVVACSWIYIYPVVSGELNYVVTGLGLGMQALNIFPPGLFLISVPFQLIPIMLENLEDMEPRDASAPGPGGDAHRERVNQFMADLRKKVEQ